MKGGVKEENLVEVTYERKKLKFNLSRGETGGVNIKIV